MVQWRPQVGETVRVGRGKKVWSVSRFWTLNGQEFAELTPLVGYSKTSAAVSRLVPNTDRPPVAPEVDRG